MVTILADGDGRHRLESPDGIRIGSLGQGVVRLDGIEARSILEASVALWRALESALARQYPGWARHHPDVAALRLEHDGAEQWVVDGRKPIARVIHPDGRPLRGHVSLEFGLPSFATDAVLISAATSMVRALEAFVAAPSIVSGSAARKSTARTGGGGDAA